MLLLGAGAFPCLQASVLKQDMVGEALPVSLQRANHFTFGSEMLPVSAGEKVMQTVV